MANFKVVISDPQSRKAYQKEVDQSTFLGKKVGEKVSGDSLGLQGYEFEITGGSDKSGFPMRGDVEGSARKKVLLSHPPGFHPEMKGQRKRKSVRGNTISPDTIQINTKVTKSGPKPLDKIFGVKEKPKEEKSVEKEKAGAGKEETKPQEKAKEPSGTMETKKEPKDGKARPEKSGVKPEEKMGIKEIKEEREKPE